MVVIPDMDLPRFRKMLEEAIVPVVAELKQKLAALQLRAEHAESTVRLLRAASAERAIQRPVWKMCPFCKKVPTQERIHCCPDCQPKEQS